MPKTKDTFSAFIFAVAFLLISLLLAISSIMISLRKSADLRAQMESSQSAAASIETSSSAQDNPLETTPSGTSDIIEEDGESIAEDDDDETPPNTEPEENEPAALPPTDGFETTPTEISRGVTSEKQVAFTFDGGSGAQSAQAILDVLAKYQVTGTFFLTGTWASQNQELVKLIALGGHEIYNHTYTHPHLTQISDDMIADELKRTEELIKSITGKTSKPYFRPPYGERNSHVLDIAAQEGYQSVYWTVDALDWKESTGMTADTVRQRILNALEPGTIYLMHIGDTITGSILDDIFYTITIQGYTIVSLSQVVT